MENLLWNQKYLYKIMKIEHPRALYLRWKKHIMNNQNQSLIHRFLLIGQVANSKYKQALCKARHMLVFSVCKSTRNFEMSQNFCWLDQKIYSSMRILTLHQQFMIARPSKKQNQSSTPQQRRLSTLQQRRLSTPQQRRLGNHMTNEFHCRYDVWRTLYPLPCCQQCSATLLSLVSVHEINHEWLVWMQKPVAQNCI